MAIKRYLTLYHIIRLDLIIYTCKYNFDSLKKNIVSALKLDISVIISIVFNSFLILQRWGHNSHKRFSKNYAAI